MKKSILLASVILAVFAIVSCNKNPSKNSYKHPLSAVADTNVVIPPTWAFGIIYGAYTNQEQSIELINQIIEHDYPIDAFWIDSWIWDWKNQGQGPAKYMDFIADTISYPDMKALWSFMEERNIKGGMWMWDAIMQTGNETEYDDFKSKGFFRAENIRTDGWHNGARTTIIGDNSEPVKGTRCGDIDFENPEAVKYFQQKVKHFFDKGVDFVKLDKTDAIPVCKAMFELSQQLGRETGGRGFVLSHSHGVDSEEYKRYPGKWTDDTRSDWNIENPTHEFSPWLPRVAFKENVAMYTDTSRHFHKIPFLANDMGGFSVGTDGKIDEELYIRWLQFAVFVPLTTPFSQPENPTGNIAFKVSEQADSLFRKYAHLKMELFPYIYSYAHQSRLAGINTTRPVNGLTDQYLFGNEILVAPVIEQGKTSREVYFPENSDWINFWSGEKIKGGQTVAVKAPLAEIPLFVRAGAIIPKRKYARSIEAGTNDLLELHIYEGADGEFTLIEDDGTSNDYLKGIYAETKISLTQKKHSSELIIDPIQGDFIGMNGVRTWEIIVHTSKKLVSATVNKGKTEFESFGNSFKLQRFSAKKDDIQKLKFQFE